MTLPNQATTKENEDAIVMKAQNLTLKIKIKSKRIIDLETIVERGGIMIEQLDVIYVLDIFKFDHLRFNDATIVVIEEEIEDLEIGQETLVIEDLDQDLEQIQDHVIIIIVITQDQDPYRQIKIGEMPRSEYYRLTRLCISKKLQEVTS